MCFKLELVAAFSTLVQSMVQIAVALLVILVHTCKLDHLQPSGNPLIVLLYTTYFYSVECGGIMVPASWSGTSATAAIILSGTPFTADRTYNFMLVYLILGGAMFITSLLLIAGAANSVRGVACYTFRAPWVVTCALTLLVDVVALVFYMVDVPKSMTMTDILTYIAATSTGIQTNLVSNTWAPAVIMATYFSRFFVIWLLNAVFMIAVIYRGHLAYCQGSQQYRNESLNVSEDNVNFKNSLEMQKAEIYDKSSASNIQHHQTSAPGSVPIPSGVATVQEQSSAITAHRQNGVVRQPSALNRSDTYVIEKRNSQSQPDASSSIFNYRKPPTPPPPPPKTSDTQLIGKVNQSGTTAIEKQQQSDVSRRISNNSTNSGAQNHKTNRTEFRGQMPWSYLNEVVAQPHRMRDQLPEDEELPPVPVPDYTLHHPKKYRAKVSRDSSDASSGRRPARTDWGGKEVLY